MRFTLIALGVALLSATPTHANVAPIAKGQATYFNKGIMEVVIANRGLQDEVAACKDCQGTVALNEPKWIGQKVILVHEGREYGPLLVVDCAEQSVEAAALKRRGWAVDVSWELAHLLGMAQRRMPLPYVEIYLFEDMREQQQQDENARRKAESGAADRGTPPNRQTYLPGTTWSALVFPVHR